MMLPGEDPLVPVPRDLRWYVITLYNRGRVRSGTGSIYRVKAILEAAKKRYPQARMSPRHVKPAMVRRRLAGPVVAVFEAKGKEH